ncbi:MAG: putative Rossmann fold flavoprotein [Planctomycetota bacterium]|jgi:predicted Rossmann fold flavoprotein
MSQELSDSAEIVIVGAGAAGLWAAGTLARGGRQVLLLEKTTRTGTKVLASGGSRCNLTTTLGPADAAALFGTRQGRFIRTAFEALPPAEVRECFDSWGVPSVTAPLEKVFPASQRAKDVRDALEREAREAGATIACQAPVQTLGQNPEGWTVHLDAGRQVQTRQLMLCPGGLSFPLTGTTGDGYRWLEELDLKVLQPLPALVPLTSPAEWARELTGISLQEGEVQLLDPAGKIVARRERPIVFTHLGLSGPGAMDVSAHVARAAAAGESGWRVRLDLVPEHSREELREVLLAAAQAPRRPRLGRVLRDLLPEPLPRRLLAAVAGEAGLPEADPGVQGLSKAQRHSLLETLKGLLVPVDGTRGFDAAEVTAGGLDLRAVNPRSMAVNGLPGLYVFGELLDLDGPIGGLNFQAAFAAAELAARHVLSE